MEPGARMAQPRIFQRVCKEVLELSENDPPCNMRELNDDDYDDMVEYIQEISQELFDLLFDEKLPRGKAQQDKLLSETFDLLYEGARADETLTIYGNEYNAEVSVFEHLFNTAAFYDMGNNYGRNKYYTTDEHKSFMNELMALLFFMGVSPENRDDILRRIGGPDQSLDTTELVLYTAFDDAKRRLSRSNEKARMIFSKLQSEGENIKWKTSFPSEVEERVLSFLRPRGGLRRIRSARRIRRIRSAHKRKTRKGKKRVTKRRIVKRRKQTRKYRK